MGNALSQFFSLFFLAKHLLILLLNPVIVESITRGSETYGILALLNKNSDINSFLLILYLFAYLLICGIDFVLYHKLIRGSDNVLSKKSFLWILIGISVLSLIPVAFFDIRNPINLATDDIYLLTGSFIKASYLIYTTWSAVSLLAAIVLYFAFQPYSFYLKQNESASTPSNNYTSSLLFVVTSIFTLYSACHISFKLDLVTQSNLLLLPASIFLSVVTGSVLVSQFFSKKLYPSLETLYDELASNKKKSAVMLPLFFFLNTGVTYPFLKNEYSEVTILFQIMFGLYFLVHFILNTHQLSKKGSTFFPNSLIYGIYFVVLLVQMLITLCN